MTASGHLRANGTALPAARSWGSSRRKLGKQTQGPAMYAIGGQADGAWRRTSRPPL